MSKLKELQEKRAKCFEQARALLDEITDVTPDVRAKELEEQHDKAMADADKLQTQIDREQKLADAEARAADELRTRRPVPAAPRTVPGSAEPNLDYDRVFRSFIRNGEMDLSPEERSILRDQGRTPEMRAQSIGTTTAGGYLVPQGFSGEIDRALAMWGPMYNSDIARVYPTSTGNPIPWPTLDYTSQSGEGPKTENSTVTDDASADAVIGQATLSSYIYDSKMVKVSYELLQDSFFDLDGLMTDLFGESLGRKVNAVLTTGTGSSQPQGIVVGAASGKTAASATAITADELIDLQHAVDPAYRDSPKCRFMFKDSVLAALRKLKDGNGQYLLQRGDITTGAPDMLLGKPYSINQGMASMTTGQKTVLFGDFSRFIVRKVGGFQTLRLNERYAELLSVGFLGFVRLDGRLLNSAAVKYLVQA